MIYDVPQGMRITQTRQSCTKPEKKIKKILTKKEEVVKKYCDIYKFTCEHSVKEAADKFGINPNNISGLMSGNTRPYIMEKMEKEGIKRKRQNRHITEATIRKAFVMACQTDKVKETAEAFGMTNVHLSNILNGKIRPYIKEEMKAKGIIWKKHRQGKINVK